MAKRCSKKYGCQKPRANWWRKSLGVDWLHSAGLSSTQGVEEPSVQATNIVFSNISSTGFTASWTNGDGSNRLVVIKSGGAVDSLPADGTGYTANTAFGSGSEIGTGNYVVYGGTGNSVSVTGLTPNTAYHVRVFEFNGAGSSSDYLTDTDTGNPASEFTFTSEYQAVLDSATALGAVKPSDAQKAKGNQLVIDLKAANIWNSLDVLMVFATDGDSAFAAIDWKNPGTRQATLINSPTHTANLGFTGNGTSSYVDPNYNPSTQGVAYTVNDAGFFGYSGLALGGGTGMFIGASDGTNFSADLNLRSAANLMQYRINGSSAQQPANTNTIGFFHVKRTSATAVACFVNGASFNSSGSNNAGTLPNREIYLLARNGSSGAMNYYTGRIACFGAGASLNGQEAALNTAWNTYFTSL